LERKVATPQIQYASSPYGLKQFVYEVLRVVDKVLSRKKEQRAPLPGEASNHKSWKVVLALQFVAAMYRILLSSVLPCRKMYLNLHAVESYGTVLSCGTVVCQYFTK